MDGSMDQGLLVDVDIRKKLQVRKLTREVTLKYKSKMYQRLWSFYIVCI